MNVLIACEESQEVCKAFRERGHRAFSADLQDCSGGHPEWHVKGDVLPLINGNCTFKTADTHTHTQAGPWDLLIAHPPCTFLTVSGNAWFDVSKYGNKARQRVQERKEGFEFFMKFVSADCDRIAIENPVGVVSTMYRKPDQIIQPYFFGDRARKTTCLWLKNLPLLQPTNIVDPGEILEGGYSVAASANYARDENWKIIPWNDPRTAKARSKTFPGIANAMAEQWGYLTDVQTSLFDGGI